MLTGFAGMYVRIVGSGYYTDRFCWFLCVCILSPYLGPYLLCVCILSPCSGPYQRLARPDILHCHYLLLAV